MHYRTLSAFAVCSVTVLFTTLQAKAQNDPGPRSGPAGAGGFYSSLNANEQNLFNQAQERFAEIDSVLGTVAGEEGKGLGPGFNASSCAQCHAQPAVGGSSPGLTSPQNPIANPQVGLANLDGASNSVPSFITSSGPVREARFISNSDGSRDGGVHDLFTVTGRSDAAGCTVAQPDFNTAVTDGNVIFRIPTPLFGLGLVEATPDATLLANLTATAGSRAALKIGGFFNTNGNDGTMTRFGWKAQNKSLLLFVGEAYNVEQGVTNELFPNERNVSSGCAFNNSPEDVTPLINGNPSSPNFNTTVGTPAEMGSDLLNFAFFSRLLGPPTPGASTSSTKNGASLFTSIGCSLCHSPSLTTGSSQFTGMSNVSYSPYSDFALHKMGKGLSDGVFQGAAGPQDFRTAPLWGLGQRLFFLHDGRTSDLIQAIQSHQSTGSEANSVVKAYNALTSTQKQDLLNFLRSL
jgi:CxxC motif-containing protein (DUF1111 family)